MNRSDEGREVKPGLRSGVAGAAKTPAAARRAQEKNDAAGGKSVHVEPAHHGEGAGMARSKAAAKSATAGEESQERSEEGGAHNAGGPGGKTVESSNAFGSASSVHAKGADSDTDNASAKANRKEAYEGERERDEEAAVDQRDVAAKHVIGHGGPREVQTNHVMGHTPHSSGARGKVGYKNTI